MLNESHKKKLKVLQLMLDTGEDPGIRVTFDDGMFHVEAMPGGHAYNTWPMSDAVGMYWAVRAGLCAGVIELKAEGVACGYRVTGVKI